MDKFKKITNGRETLLAVVLFILMISLGVGLFFLISEGNRENLRRYEIAYKAESEVDFQYAKKTKLGDVLAYGLFESIGTISDSKIEGEYLAIKIRIERYTQHVTTRVVDGKTETTITYSWDYIDSTSESVEHFTFLGIEGNTKELSNLYSYTDTVYNRNSFWSSVGDLRYQIYTIPAEFYGTGFWSFTDETRLISAWKDMNIEETINECRLSANLGPKIFLVLWGIFTVGIVAGFIFLENRWLYENISRN